MGLSLMRYVRACRMCQAARQLAVGAEDILRVVLDAGYGSHEAFTRAFREHFGLTPQEVRAQGHLDNLRLVEAIPMNTTPVPDLAAPRDETHEPMLPAGLVERYNCESTAGISGQWQRFSAYFGTIPRQVGKFAYGVSFHFDNESNFDYLCGVEVASGSELPKGLTSLSVPNRNTLFSRTWAMSRASAACSRRSMVSGFRSRGVRWRMARHLSVMGRSSTR